MMIDGLPSREQDFEALILGDESATTKLAMVKQVLRQ
jgi:hypothetical protein